MYRLIRKSDGTISDNSVLRVEDMAIIPLGHRWWDEYQKWLYDGNSPEDAESPSAEQLKANRLSANNYAYEQATVAITADYPQLEKDTWPTQDAEAQAWLNDPVNAATPWIDSASSERGIPREEYLRRTLIKSRQFKAVSAFLTGRRQKFEDAIKSGSDPILDYRLTAAVMQQLQQIANDGMNRPVHELSAFL